MGKPDNYRYSAAQIKQALDEVSASKTIKEVSAQLGMSTNSIVNWKRKFGSMTESQIDKMIELERANDLLKIENKELQVFFLACGSTFPNTLNKEEKLEAVRTFVKEYNVPLVAAIKFFGMSVSSYYNRYPK
ncbi:transposase [Thalassotalea litorea]|uniref:transposase n=1 Tax=Thalassotalea litorea TaxID=2020715 RepID=UPI0037356DA0